MSPEWYEWLRKNMPPHLFEGFESERIHSARWRDDEISRLQSALAAETKRREEAETGLETLLGMLRENGINPEGGVHQIAEERDALQAGNARLREALKAVEYGGEDEDCCPICMAMRKEGHGGECIIGAALAKPEGGAE